MPERPKLLYHMGLVSFRLFCKNLGNLQEFFGQMVYRPPWPKIARTPMRAEDDPGTARSKQTTSKRKRVKSNDCNKKPRK